MKIRFDGVIEDGELVRVKFVQNGVPVRKFYFKKKYLHKKTCAREMVVNRLMNYNFVSLLVVARVLDVNVLGLRGVSIG